MSLRVRRLTADGVGPLRGLTLNLSDLTVIEGDNESGKSSVVVALHRGLSTRFCRRNARSLEPGSVRLGVPGYDGGTVEVELAGTDDGELPALLRDEPLLWNLLIIPEGRAAFTEVSTADWFSESQEHLTGFDAAAYADRIRARGGFTPTERDAAEWSRRCEEIDSRIRQIQGLIDSLAALPGMQEDLRRAENQLETLEASERQEQDAIAFERYARSLRALSTLEGAQEGLPRYQRYARSDLNAWRDHERTRASLSARLEQAREHDHAADAGAARERVENLQREEREAADAVARIAESGILERARWVGDHAVRADEQMSTSAWLTPIGVILAVAGAIAIVTGLAFSSLPLMLGGLLGLPGVGLLVLRGRFRAGARRAAAEIGRVLADGTRLGVEAGSVQELLRAAERAQQRVDTLRGRLETAVEEQNRCNEALKAQGNAVSALSAQLEKAERGIGDVRDRAGVRELNDLEAKIHERETLEGQRASARDELVKLLGPGDIPQWRRAVDAMQISDPGAAPTTGRLEELRAQLREQRELVRRLDRQASGALDTALAAAACPDLPAAWRELSELEEERRARTLARDGARIALDAVREEEGDLESHLDRAIDDPEHGAGVIFAQISSGRWSGLRRTEDGGFAAVASDGGEVPFKALSRGTQDQLLFAVRAAMAERVLGAPAFFVWDDTFLTADPRRRACLIHAAVALVQRGWQVIYLTLDPSIADRFEHVAEKAGITSFRHVSLSTEPTRSA